MKQFLLVFFSLLSFFCFAGNKVPAKAVKTYTLGNTLVGSQSLGFTATADATKSISGVLLVDAFTDSSCTNLFQHLTLGHNVAYYILPVSITSGGNLQVTASALYSTFWNQMSAVSAGVLATTPADMADAAPYVTIMIVRTYDGSGYAPDVTTPPSNYQLYNTTGGAGSTCVHITCNDAPTRICTVTPTTGESLAF